MKKIENKLLKWSEKLDSPLTVTVIVVIATIVVFSLENIFFQVEQFEKVFFMVITIPVLVGYPVSYMVQLYKKRVHSQKEQLEKEVELKKNMISVLSHDLRGPLASVVGLLQLLQHEVKGESNEELMKIANQEVDKTLLLTDNLLKWISTHEEPDENYHMKINFSRLMEEVRNNHQMILENKGIQLHIANNISEEIRIDRDSNQLIIRNLVSNAIKFSNPGDSIFVSADIRGDKLIYSVRDEGQGMIPAKVAQLMNNVKVGSTAGTSDEMGHGLGLSLCKYFINRQGGDLLIESKAGIGSNFMVEVPLL